MTDTETATLTAWLGVQLDADEADINRGRSHNGGGTFANDNYGCLLVQPEHALAQVAALRAIVEREERRLREAWRSRIDEHHLSWEEWLADWPTPTLDDLASIYADRDGYRAEWAL